MNKAASLKSNFVSYTFTRFSLHLVIAILYFGLSSWFFVTDKSHKSPDPIGIGLLQDICMLVHLIITLIVSRGTRNRIINLVIVLLIVILYFLLSNWIWNWLWSLR